MKVPPGECMVRLKSRSFARSLRRPKCMASMVRQPCSSVLAQWRLPKRESMPFRAGQGGFGGSLETLEIVLSMMLTVLPMPYELCRIGLSSRITTRSTVERREHREVNPRYRVPIDEIDCIAGPPSRTVQAEEIEAKPTRQQFREVRGA